ncbi:hypothetical protein [Deinococcus altitudinis]|uniref:hypothetical protein n=1 Tax=Deinococcus altitudinis TaxID=468914 RepID=UPI003891953B
MIFDSGRTIGRYHLLHPLMMVVLAHGGFGLVCLLRPNLASLFKAYSTFGPMTFWGMGLWGLCLLLLLAPRASVWLMLSELVSAAVFFAIGGLLTIGVGLLPTGMVMFDFGVTSLLLFQRSFGIWLSHQPWYLDRLVDPPHWVRRLRFFHWLRRHFGGDDG